MPTPGRSSRLEVGWWLLALLLVRGLSILALAEVGLFGEELEKGAGAKAILDGLDVPYHELAFHYYEGGGFVVSHLKALLFALVGENLLAQRLAGLTTCVLVFAACWRLLDHHFGRRAARVGALLYLFGPECFQRYSLLSLGIHFEAMAFGVFVLDGGLRLAFDREREPTALGLGLLGLVAGFGVFFSYQNALTVGWAGLLFLGFRPRVLFGRRGLAGIAGFAVGLSPLLLMAWQVGGAVLDIHGEDLAGGGGGARLLLFFRAVYVLATPWELVSRIGYPAAALAVIAVGIGRGRSTQRRAFLGLFGFAVLWATVWATGPFVDVLLIGWFSWVRLAPLLVVGLLLAAAAVAIDWSVPVRGLLVAVTALGVVHAGVIVAGGRPDTPGRNVDFLLHTKGYDYRGYLHMLLGHRPSRRPVDVAPVLGYDEVDPGFLRTSFAVALFENRRRGVPLATQIAQLDRLDPGGRRDFLRGLGASLLVSKRGDVKAALRQLAEGPQELAQGLAEGMGYFPGHGLGYKESLLRDLEAHGHGPMGEAYTRGLGMRAYRNLVMSTMGCELTLDEAGVRALLVAQDPALAPLLLEGFEEERERWRLPDGD